MTVAARSAMPSRPPDRRPGPRSRRPGRASGALLAVVLALAATFAVAAPASSAPPPLPEPDADVLVQWDRIALRTVYDATRLPQTGVPRGAPYTGYVQLAVYDAVVAVEGG